MPAAQILRKRYYSRALSSKASSALVAI